MKIVALIPAKKKSERLPNKNIRLLNEIPLVGHTILAALNCMFFDHVIVLTNSETIKEIAHVMGATPMHDPLAERRPEPTGGELARFVLNELNLNDEDVLIYLQPTAPLRDSIDIHGAYNTFMEKCVSNDMSHPYRGKTVVSVTNVKHHPSWCFRKNSHGFIHPHTELIEKSQDLEPLFVLNGAIYISSVKQLREHGSFFNTEMVEYEMDYHKSIDIDDEIDFFIAGALLKRLELQKKEVYFQLEK